MELLINKNTVSEYLQVAIGCSEQSFNIYIEEAQEFDLQPLIGEFFFNSLLKNKDNTDWQSLMNGGTYEYKKTSYRHSGIKKVLSYFTYARYMLKSNIVSSSHGLVIKKTPNSEPINLQERKNFYYSYQKDANTLFNGVNTYIKRNSNIFKNYQSTNSTSNTNFRIIQ